ncbi:TRM8_1 [Sanghuangporus weigelae]
MVSGQVQAAAGVATLSIVLPFALRVLLSPWTFVFILPFLLCTALLVGFSAHVYLAYLVDKRKRHSRQISLRVSRPFAFSTPAAWQAVLTRSKWSRKSPQSLPQLYPDYPMVSTTVNEILILVVRDYVLTWYTEISSSPSFPTAVSEAVHDSLETLLKRLESMDLASLIVRRILPKLTNHVELFRYSETALRGAKLERHLTQSEELDLLLASRYVTKGGSLHPAVENLSTTFTRQTEEMHLKSLVEAALPLILPRRDSNSKAVRILVREVLACTVLAPITDLLSDPDFWNRTIDQLAGAAIRQQKLITKVRNILESQSPSPTTVRHGKLKRPHQELITLQTNARHFEAFLRSIDRCDSLLDARRLKNDVVGEIRRTRTLLARHENEDWIGGKRTEDVVAFLDRLYTAKRKIEKRIAILGGQDDSSPLLQDSDTIPSLTLRDVLTNPSSLSYFMEFMDRRGRSLLVQFWLTVESFKNPLESVDSDSSDEDYEPLADPALAATLKEDLNMINDLYFANPVTLAALSSISQKYVLAIQSYATEESASALHERKARRSVMLAQKQVERDMDHDFEDFKRSDLWFRAIGDLATKDRSNEPPPSTASTTQEENTSTSAGLLASLVQGLTPDLSRSQTSKPPFFRRARSARSVDAPSNTAPAIMRPRSSMDSAKSLTAASPPSSRSTSAQAPSSSLEILMASSLDVTSEAPHRAPLFDEAEDGRLLSADAEEAQRMEAIQAAVTDIIASETNTEIGHKLRARSFDEAPEHFADDHDRRDVRSYTKPIFADSQIIEIVDEQTPDDDDLPEGPSEMTNPGDLHLPHEISRLADKITHLQSQDGILDNLIKKAELTGDAQELRLLQKSKAALERELRQLSFQKMQYEQQDTASKLIPGRTKATIVNSTTGEEDGKQVVRYLIEVQQLGTGWVVARRYSEFLAMHQRLKERFLPVKSLEFPGKHLVTSLSTQMLDNRRIALEKYLQNLLTIPIVCESPELRSFLSRDSPFIAKSLTETSAKESTVFPGQNIVRNMYRSFTESIDEVFFGPSMLDVMIGRLTRQAAEFAGIVGTASNDEDLVSQALRATGKEAPEDTLAQLPGDLKPLEGETSTSSFTSPICDLVLAVFELDKTNNWLRRQAIVIILQQVFGDTVERKFRETMSYLLDEPHLLSYINIFKDSMWLNGRPKPPEESRSAEERARTRDEANRKLATLLPDIAANMIGRSNARRGARRIFAVLQNRRLNQHIVYTVLDEVFSTLFPEVNKTITK